MDTLGLTSLDKVVKKSLFRNKWSISEYKLVFSLVVDGMRDLNLFTIKNSKTVRLKMSDINTIELPLDYLSFISLSVPTGGRMFTMTEDKMLVSPMTVTNGVEILDKLQGEGVIVNKNSIPFAGYGITGGVNDYYYKIEPENKRIVISGFAKSIVTLTYKSSGVSTTSETLIPVIAEEALLSFVNWKKSISEREIGWSQKFEQDYYAECNKIKHLECATLDEFYDALYSTYTQTPKR